MTTLGTAQYLNTFSQNDVRGREDAKLNFNKIPVKIIAETDEIISAGDMVKLVPGGKTISTVSQIKSTDQYSAKDTYGFIPLARMKNTYGNKDMTTMCLSGCIMEMIAEEEIQCGQEVAYDATTTNPQNTGKIKINPSVAAAGVILCGVAMNDANENQIVRVKIK